MKPSKWLTAALASIAGALLPACDALNLQELTPGVSTAADVRARMGLPTAEFPNPDGSVVYEYSRQPNGVDCYMLTIGADQVLRQIDQVLTEANLARIRAGMSRAEVRRLLGAPGRITTYPGLKEEVWDWRVAGTIPTEEAYFSAHFDLDGGMVSRTSRRVEIRG